MLRFPPGPYGIGAGRGCAGAVGHVGDGLLGMAWTKRRQMLSFVVVSMAFWECGVRCLSVFHSVCDILGFQPIMFPGICSVWMSKLPFSIVLAVEPSARL